MAKRHGRPQKYPQELRDLALQALDSGQSVREVAALAEVPASTVHDWNRRRRERVAREQMRERFAPPPPVPASPVAEDSLPEIDPEAGTLAISRALQGRLVALAEEARGVGNFTAAQRFLRDAAALGNTIARQEKVEAADADAIRISRAEILEALDRKREQLRALLTRPLLCAHCARELSVEWGEG